MLLIWIYAISRVRSATCCLAWQKHKITTLHKHFFSSHWYDPTGKCREQSPGLPPSRCHDLPVVHRGCGGDSDRTARPGPCTATPSRLPSSLTLTPSIRTPPYRARVLCLLNPYQSLHSTLPPLPPSPTSPPPHLTHPITSSPPPPSLTLPSHLLHQFP